MIDIDRYNNLKKKCGKYSSWAIWQEAGEKPKSNTGDMSIFDDDEKICDRLNDKYVFVGLNVSRSPGDEPWKNFHSDSPYQNDYKLRHVLTGTKFWGSYITDIIKNHEQVKSSEVRKALKKDPSIIDKNIKKFQNELNCLSDEKPILIAMGKDACKILKNNMEEEYTIHGIRHYSANGGPEFYKDKVWSVLKEI